MNSNNDIKEIKSMAKRKLVPQLRFPEFSDAGEWEEKQLHRIASPVSERAKGNNKETALTLSAEYGIVSQGDYFGKRIAGENVDRYIKISLNDFVYNDRITKLFTYGTIKRLSQYQSGLVSPIYKCFRFKKSENPVFWEWYFESGNHEIPLQKLVNEGARAGRFNISIQKFLSITIWTPEFSEQQKIADCLTSLDDRLTAETQKLETLKNHKKGLMQALFPAEGKLVPQLRFPEFRDAREWKAYTLIQLAKFRRGSFPQPYGLPKWYDESNGMPFIQVFDVGDDLQLKPSTKSMISKLASEQSVFIPKGTVIITIQGSIGRVAITQYDAYIDRTLLLFEKFLKPIEKIFFAYSIQILFSIEKQKAPGGIIKTITKEVLSNFMIKLPSIKEQQKIADSLSSIDELITLQVQKIEVLKQYKKGLMQQLFPSIEEVEV